MNVRDNTTNQPVDLKATSQALHVYPTAGGSSGSPAYTAGLGYLGEHEVTRPADTTAYAIGDVVGGVFSLANAGPSGGGLILVNALDLMVYVSAVPAGMGSFRMHFYGSTPPSALADNAAFDIPSGDRSAYLGFHDLTVPLDRGSSIHTQAVSVNRVLRLTSSTLFAYLETLAAYTPTSAAVHRLRAASLGA